MVISSINCSYRTYRCSDITREPLLVRFQELLVVGWGLRYRQFQGPQRPQKKMKGREISCLAPCCPTRFLRFVAFGFTLGLASWMPVNGHAAHTSWMLCSPCTGSLPGFCVNCSSTTVELCKLVTVWVEATCKIASTPTPAYLARFLDILG